MTGQRDSSLDVMKGILILLVVLNHVTGISNKCGIHNNTFDVLHIIRELYVPFFMPAFFIVTGICSNFDKPFNSFIWKNFKTIIFPSICISLVFIILDGNIEAKKIIKTILTGGGKWFLCALFLAKITYWLLNKINNNYIIGTILVIMLCIGVTCVIYDLPNYWFYQQALCMTLFLFIGHHYSVTLTKKPYMLTGGYILVLTLLLCFDMSRPSIVNKLYVSYLSTPSFLFLSVTGSYSLLAICKKIKHCKLLEFFGKESLIIYLVHMPILYYVIPLFEKQVSNQDKIGIALGYYIFFFLFSCAISAFAALILQTRYLRFIKGRF